MILFKLKSRPRVSPAVSSSPPTPSFQIAGLLSAIIVMIVTLAVGFLLDPLPKVGFVSSVLRVFVCLHFR